MSGFGWRGSLGGMAMFGCPCRRKRDPFCNAARASFDSRNRIEFQELTAASYCGVWNKNIGSGCAVLPYRMILPVPGSGRLVLFEAYPTRDVIHRKTGGERCSCSMPVTGPFGRSRRNRRDGRHAPEFRCDPPRDRHLLRHQQCRRTILRETDRQ
jgi:hypothetical protein